MCGQAYHPSVRHSVRAALLALALLANTCGPPEKCVPFGTMSRVVDILAENPPEEAAEQLTRIFDVNFHALEAQAGGDIFEFNRLVDEEIANWEEQPDGSYCRDPSVPEP